MHYAVNFDYALNVHARLVMCVLSLQVLNPPLEPAGLQKRLPTAPASQQMPNQANGLKGMAASQACLQQVAPLGTAAFLACQQVALNSLFFKRCSRSPNTSRIDVGGCLLGLVSTWFSCAWLS